MDNEYSAYRDGQFVTVPSIDKLCLALKDKFLREEERIAYLEKENERLKSEAYKDNEISRLSKENERLKSDLYRGFPISERESKKIKEWLSNHECPYRNMKIGSSITYEFQPTEVGIFGTIKCSCGKEFNFQNGI